MAKEIFILIIYDVCDDKRRRKLVKILNSFGYRVQYSAFEAILPEVKYRKLVGILEKVRNEEDSIRIYQMKECIGQKKGILEFDMPGAKRVGECWQI